MVGQVRKSIVVLLTAILLQNCGSVVQAGSSQLDVDSLRREVNQLRKQASEAAAPIQDRSVDTVLASKYGPGSAVTTKSGKLSVNGLVQVWFYSFQNDHKALFDDPNINSVSDSNDGSNENSFRIRRLELVFTMDITENVTAKVRLDPARELSSFPLIIDNQVNTGTVYKAINNVGPQHQKSVGSQDPSGFGSTKTISNLVGGAGAVPRLLELAYVNYHGVVPHHDFTVGQFIPYAGEENLRNNGQLDFIERSFAGSIDARYAAGAAFHGTWWDERFQYWGSVHDGPGNFFFTAGDSSNRSDDNEKKDLGYRLLLRPVYKDETWGSLEIGGGTLFGWHGNSNNPAPLSNPENRVVGVKTNAYDHFAWLCYQPGAVVSGLWLRGEWKLLRDRMAPGSVVDLAGNGTFDKSIYTQELGKPISTSGFYAAIGYKLSESAFRNSCPSWFKPFEFAGRYQEFQNVLIADPNNPAHTDIFRTRAVTGGANYYIKGHDAKIQLNYNWVYNPRVNTADVSFHNTRDDSFALNFQVAF